MAKFRIATPAGTSYTTASDYGYEMEALASIDAEIFEIPAGTEDEFVAAAKEADALYAKGRRITKKMIDGLGRCKIISLGSVGVDTVDVDAATFSARCGPRRGIIGRNSRSPMTSRPSMSSPSTSTVPASGF